VHASVSKDTHPALTDEHWQSPSNETLKSNFVGHQGAEPEALRKFLDEIVRLGMQFKTQSKVKTAPMPTPAVKSFEPLPTNGITYEELIQCYAEIAAPSTNWASPNFMGFPDSGNAAPALGAALLIPFLNQNLANQEICAPVATFIEMEVVHWLRQLLGYRVPDTYTSSQDAGGVLTLGGTLSNTIALMAARENTFPGTFARGLPVPAQKVRLLVPDVIEHYSVRSAMAWLGLGEQNIVRVPVDDLFRVQLDDLDHCIDEERAKGNYVMACVAYAGDSRSMRVDNLDNIADRVHKKGVWFHVDACHGGMLAFSRTHRHKIRGINKADSITIDPHKVLWVPYTCSFVLFKDPKSLSMALLLHFYYFPL
jgi:L-2,4-diaminobutyrate decarboxylase